MTVNGVNEKQASVNADNLVRTAENDVGERKSSINKGNLQSISTDLLQELSLYEFMNDGLMKPAHVQSGWSMINTLASFAVSKANLLKRHDEKLLPSAIMRIALDIFDSRDQLEKPLNSETIERLLGKESEHVPVALELLDWILSGEMILPALTEELKDDFDFLAALKSHYHESATKEPTIEKLDQEKKRAQMVDWIFGLTAMVPSLPDKTYFSAVYILDCLLMEHAERIYKLSDEENQSVWIAAVKLAAEKEMGSVNGKGLGAQRHRRRSTSIDPIRVIECVQLRVVERLGCEAEEIKHWEEEHAKTVDISTNAPTHMQWTHLVRKLRESRTVIEGLMKPGQVRSGCSMINTLASFAVSKASLKRHGPLLLASAIMRITLDIFASRCHLKKTINTEIYKLLLGKESEHVPVALELLDWILSGEMILPALTEELKDDFDFLAALKSHYHESATKEPTIEKLDQETKRAQMVDWIFSLTAVVPSLPDLPFSAVDILDCSLMEHAERIYELSDEENRPVLVAALKLAASAVNPECALRSAIDKLGCEAEEIKHWEEEHAKTLDVSINASAHMQWTHLVQKLRESLTVIEGLMKPGQVRSGCSMINTLASFAVSKTSLLKQHDALLLPAAIMWITLEFFDSRKQLLKPLDPETIESLFGDKIVHARVALELLNWILSNEMLCPALTEKMKDAKSEFRKISRHMQIICDVLPDRCDFDQ